MDAGYAVADGEGVLRVLREREGARMSSSTSWGDSILARLAPPLDEDEARGASMRCFLAGGSCLMFLAMSAQAEHAMVCSSDMTATGMALVPEGPTMRRPNSGLIEGAREDLGWQ